jgi:hypothetical protein
MKPMADAAKPARPAVKVPLKNSGPLKRGSLKACRNSGAEINLAAQKAIANAMESFVDKVINTGALDPVMATSARQ